MYNAQDVLDLLRRQPKHFRVKVDAAGRMVLPKEIRRAMHINGEVTLEMDERGVHMQTLAQRIKQMQEYMAPYRPKPGEELVSDELIRERREEQAREDAKTEAWLSAHKHD